MNFIHSKEAGRFLAWLADSDFKGCINATSYGSVSLTDIISYVEGKTNRRAIFAVEGDEAPYNGTPEYSMDLSKAVERGFIFSELDRWIYNLLDLYINNYYEG